MNLRANKIYTGVVPSIYTNAVKKAVRNHLYSYRTQKLSSLVPKILCWRRHGKIGICCIPNKRKTLIKRWVFFFCALHSNANLPPTASGEEAAVYLRCLHSFIHLKFFMSFSLLRKSGKYAPVRGILNGICCIPDKKRTPKDGCSLFLKNGFYYVESWFKVSVISNWRKKKNKI